jgi:hypothetical protein
MWFKTSGVFMYNMAGLDISQMLNLLFTNGVLSKITWVQEEEVIETADSCILRGFVMYTHERSFWTISWRTVRCTGHVANMGELRNAFRSLVVKPGGKRMLVKSGLGRVTLKLFLKKQGM